MRITTVLLMAAVLGSVGCSTQSTQSTTASITDADLTQTVKSKLAADPQLGLIEIDADAAHNVVTLSGSVSSEPERNEAVDLAKTVTPSVTVIDKIDVTPQVLSRSEYTEEMARTTERKAKALGSRIGRSLDDAWVYSKIEAKLVSHSAAPALKINVDVEGNVVTLRGEVPSTGMKLEAERIAKETDGVKVVRNLLQVKA